MNVLDGKFIVVRAERVASKLWASSSVKNLGYCFSKDEDAHNDLKIKASERLKTFGAVKKMRYVRSVRLGEKKGCASKKYLWSHQVA